MRIVFPEFNNPIIKQALAAYSDLYTASVPSQLRPSEPYLPIEPISAPDLTTACNLITSGAADAMIAGIDYSSRDVILACRDHFGMAKIPAAFANISPDSSLYSTFSGLAVMQRQSETYLLADMAACKHPTKSQMLEIIAQTLVSAAKILPSVPRAALLSFSTAGSGGRDDTITLMQDTLTTFQALPTCLNSSPANNSPSSGNHSFTNDEPPIENHFFIDGEMQVDAALNPTVAAKKFSASPVAGQANVLIAPDLNSGNLLYKAFEQLAGFTVAGPILQGFNFPVSDLSRGSTVADVVLTIETMTRLAQ